MSFDRRDIRPAMDVYTLDNAYLGSILRVMAAPVRPASLAPPPADDGSSEISGEALGPAPTRRLGNRGPTVQGARAAYATAPDGAAAIVGGTIVVGAWWGLAGRRAIPIEAVLTVSLERVVLRLRRDELDQQPW